MESTLTIKEKHKLLNRLYYYNHKDYRELKNKMDNARNKKKYNENVECRKQVSITNNQCRMQKIQTSTR